MRVWVALVLAAGLTASDDVKPYTLENGMKVLIQEDHAIPNVAMYFFFRIGSRNEAPGTTGVSHFFEHMMFNGAKKYGPKQFDIQMEKAGGNNNAYTTKDVTVYTDSFPRTALELMFDMEADRIQNLNFDPKIIESERGVVYSERRLSVDNNNDGLLSEQLHAAAFMAHPYQWPVLGWASDIESWTIADLKHHFRSGYAPNNCALVIVGDVDTTQVMKLARKYLEPIPKQAPPAPIRTKEPEQRGERRLVVHKPAQLPLQHIVFHVPESKHSDFSALQVLETAFSKGHSSRLYRRMVDRDQIALAVDAMTDYSLDPYLFGFRIQPRSGVDPSRTEQVLYEEIELLRTTPMSAGELRKAKNQLLAEHYRELKTIAGRANLIGTYETYFGDYRRLFNFDKELEAVSAADLQRVAKEYLTDRNRTVATLLPEEVKQ